MKMSLEEIAQKWNVYSSTQADFAVENGLKPDSVWYYLKQATTKGLLTRPMNAANGMKNKVAPSTYVRKGTRSALKPKAKPEKTATIVPIALTQHLDEAFADIFSREKLSTEDIRSFRRVQNILERGHYGPQ